MTEIGVRSFTLAGNVRGNDEERSRGNGSPALLSIVENWMVRRGWIQAIVRQPIAAYESTGEMPSISAPITTGHRAIVCTRPRSPVRIHRPASSFVIILWFEMILYQESCLCTDESCAQRSLCALYQDHGGKYKSNRLCFFFFFFFYIEAIMKFNALPDLRFYVF